MLQPAEPPSLTCLPFFFPPILFHKPHKVALKKILLLLFLELCNTQYIKQPCFKNNSSFLEKNNSHRKDELLFGNWPTLPKCPPVSPFPTSLRSPVQSKQAPTHYHGFVLGFDLPPSLRSLLPGWNSGDVQHPERDRLQPEGWQEPEQATPHWPEGTALESFSCEPRQLF